MSLIETREKIKELIKRFYQIDVKRITPEASVSLAWNGVTNSEVLRMYKEVSDTFKQIDKAPELLEALSYSHIVTFRDTLKEFISSLDTYNSIPLDQITSHHHSALDLLNQLLTLLSSNGLSAVAKLQPEFLEKLNKFPEAEQLMDVLISNNENLKQATEQANEWIGARKRVDEIALAGQAKAFSDRAQENKHKGFHLRDTTKFKVYDYEPNWWLVMTFVMASVLFFITWRLINLSQNTESISVGIVLLRISSLLVPGYLTLFCANQYSYHKKLYESYMFKHASLNTMSHLLSTRTQEQQAEILSKGLSSLFSEPAAKDSAVKYDSQLVTEMLGIIKSQMK